MHPIRANRPAEETEGILRQFNFSKKKVAIPKTNTDKHDKPNYKPSKDTCQTHKSSE